MQNSEQKENRKSTMVSKFTKKIIGPRLQNTQRRNSLRAKQELRQVIEELKMLHYFTRKGEGNQQEYDFLQRRKQRITERIAIEEQRQLMRLRDRLYNEHKQEQKINTSNKI